MKQPPEPLVVVWRNRIPHRCALIYWGRRWTSIGRMCRLMPTWSAHAPVNGAEYTCIRRNGWSAIAMYNADGSPLMFGAKTNDPEISIDDWPMP
ncbi:hypothetical protein [Mycobacteroides immunogenum]|uniref:Uncharacterized protein n=1 Tax=Mycobacteroides immunogenum TaxID=83262 RepID=A0A7V8RXR8_9MYCO|nr:hypothetical protein [Mycobacteroides immunogenum]AMT72063.1 hypothetical protein ABG82_18980 [Mycobacteroides immunogenum]ANO05193.1 hypothetical protein BAB75_19250 [Mycobacteroides immunogenum]KIU40138.1 hypothetical protein TL11_12700 [Mycobacteroides immunogenum]KPG13635.1 hypothetical protein AN909_04975 [Mycobacteroides immunogenum]KPG14444.1 hypothetical protein AN908_07890 [Mycobacteroides immunogenum]